MNSKVHDMGGRSGLGYKKHHHANSTTLLHAFFIIIIIIIIIITHDGTGGSGSRTSTPSFCTTKQLQHKEGRREDGGPNTRTNLHLTDFNAFVVW